MVVLRSQGVHRGFLELAPSSSIDQLLQLAMKILNLVAARVRRVLRLAAENLSHRWHYL
jgi:hypothetical protein